MIIKSTEELGSEAPIPGTDTWEVVQHAGFPWEVSGPEALGINWFYQYRKESVLTREGNEPGREDLLK